MRADFPFLDALQAGRMPVIAEVKLRDPDGSDLAAGRAPEAIAQDYDTRGAAALSVVTGRWFGGTPDLLRRVAEAAPQRAILRKDFITSEPALDQSRALGCHAVLLTAAISSLRLPRLIEAALARGLTPFVEIATEAETLLVPRDLPCVIAVNNADIATREREGTGPGRSLALLEAVTDRRPALRVAASRIETAKTAQDLLHAGFDALLIGTALMRRPALLTDIAAHGALSEPPHVA